MSSFRAYPAPSNTTLHGTGSRSNANGHDRNLKNDGSSSSSSLSKGPSGLSAPVRSTGTSTSTSTSTGTSTMKNVAPAYKRIRANPYPSSTFRSTADELTKMADEGIKKRRAELRNLQSGRSSTVDLLARAKAVTSGRASASALASVTSGAPRTFSSHGSHSFHSHHHAPPPQNDLNGNPYPSRTRPIALPKSPPRQRFVPNSNSSSSSSSSIGQYQRKPLVASSSNGNVNGNGNVNANVLNIERNTTIETTPNKAVVANGNAGLSAIVSKNIKTDENTNINTNIKGKPNSPNQEVKVHAQFIPSSEMAVIKPIKAITEQVEAKNKLLSKNSNDPPPTSTVISKNDANMNTNTNTSNDSSIGQNETQSEKDSSKAAAAAEELKNVSTNAENGSVPKSESIPASTPLSAPAPAPTQVPMPEVKEISSVPLVSPTPVVTKEKSVQEEKKAETNTPSPFSTSEPSKRRETMKFLRDAALSPAVTSIKKKEKKEQVLVQEGAQQIVTKKDDSPKLIMETNTNGGEIADKQPVVENNKNKAVQQSSQTKIMKELLEAKQLREHALKQVAQLEKEVLELRLEREKSGYHRQQEGIMRKDRSRSLSRSSRRKRMKSPQPTNRIRTDISLNPLNDINIACRAVETVEDVYSSDLATYIVRKPYGGNETMEYSFPQKAGDSMDNCKVSWHQPVKTYLKTAKVQEEASIEVISRVEADNSVLLLHGSSCRHGIAVLGSEGSTNGYEWKSYDDIEKMDGSLGRIIYIDANGNDGEYWLDSIYEEALKIRENYCSNVYSAALALKASSPKTSNSQNHSIEDKKQQMRNASPGTKVASPPVMNSPSNHFSSPDEEPTLQKEEALENQLPAKTAPKMVDACVGTEDLPKSKVPEKNIPKPKDAPKPVTQESDQAEIESGSTDALSAFVIFFFGTIFSIFWFAISIPFRIMKWTGLLSIFCVCISMLWLYLADDNGAMNLGAGIDYHLNSPGVR